jgi:hypothetical protein
MSSSASMWSCTHEDEMHRQAAAGVPTSFSDED